MIFFTFGTQLLDAFGGFISCRYYLAGFWERGSAQKGHMVEHLHWMQWHSRHVQVWSGRARHPGPFGAKAATSSTSNETASYEQSEDHLQWESSKRSLPVFKFSVPFHLAIQIICTDRLTTNLPGTADGPPNMLQVQAVIRSLASWGIKSLLEWFKGIEVWEVFGWYEEAPVKPCHLLMQTLPSSQRNGKTQPTQRLGCIRVVRTLSFPYAILLWSSTKQWNCELASRKSQQHQNPSLTKGKRMSCCRPGGWSSFSKPWHWV